VVGEENLVQGEPCLILERKEPSNVSGAAALNICVDMKLAKASMLS
jgi:hypothetical protein